MSLSDPRSQLFLLGGGVKSEVRSPGLGESEAPGGAGTTAPLYCGGGDALTPFDAPTTAYHYYNRYLPQAPDSYPRSISTSFWL